MQKFIKTGPVFAEEIDLALITAEYNVPSRIILPQPLFKA